jgi:predicted transcriptional regulator
MSEPITISFVGTTELKALLERWAKEDDRSVSWVMRQILKKEARHRQRTYHTEQNSINQLTEGR